MKTVSLKSIANVAYLADLTMSPSVQDLLDYMAKVNYTDIKYVTCDKTLVVEVWSKKPEPDSAELRGFWTSQKSSTDHSSEKDLIDLIYFRNNLDERLRIVLDLFSFSDEEKVYMLMKGVDEIDYSQFIMEVK